MGTHIDNPALAELSALVHKQRRLLAGQLRITREERGVREDIDAVLARAGVQSIDCDGYALNRVVRDGKHFATVTPIKESSTTTT